MVSGTHKRCRVMTLIEYYRANQNAIGILVSPKALFLLSFVASFDGISLSEVSGHLGWPAEEIRTLWTEIENSGLGSGVRDGLGVLRVSAEGTRFLTQFDAGSVEEETVALQSGNVSTEAALLAGRAAEPLARSRQ